MTTTISIYLSILAVYSMELQKEGLNRERVATGLCGKKKIVFLLYFISDRWMDRKIDRDGWISFFQMSDVFFVTFFTLPAHTLPGFKPSPLFTSSSSSSSYHHHCFTATVVPPAAVYRKILCCSHMGRGREQVSCIQLLIV